MNSADGTTYKVELSRSAERYLERLDRVSQKRIVAALRTLANNPATTLLDIVPLSGGNGEKRLRVGKFRIIYEIVENVLLIYVLEIGPRGDVYKK